MKKWKKLVITLSVLGVLDDSISFESGNAEEVFSDILLGNFVFAKLLHLERLIELLEVIMILV